MVEQIEEFVLSVPAGPQERRCIVLEAMGSKALRYQENYREEWKLGEVTLDLDTWPGLSAFLEIEGPGEDAVRATAEVLGLDFAHASYGSIDEV